MNKLFKSLLAFFLLSSFAFGIDISGFYALEKDEKGNRDIVEVFKKDDIFYAFGFANQQNIQDDTKKGKIFLWAKCQNDECKGEIYSFTKKKVYPILLSKDLEGLKIKIDVFFGPKLKWQSLNQEQIQNYSDKRITMDSLDLTLFNKDAL